MRDFVRLISISVVSFAIVGAAMVYSRGGDVGKTLLNAGDSIGEMVADLRTQDTGTPPQTVSAPSLGAETPPTYPVTIRQPFASRWVGLAGLPDQTEVGFTIPRGGDYISGQLNLALETQLNDSGDGLVTISINGTSRGQIVLSGGQQTHQANIDLTQADLSGREILLQLSGRGTTTSGVICPTDAANSGSAVTVLPDTALELMSSKPLADAVTYLAASAPLALSMGETGADKALTIWGNQQLKRGGVMSRIGTAGTDETPVILAQDAANMVGTATANQLVGFGAINRLISAAGNQHPLLKQWPVSVDDLLVDTTVKSFRGTRRWTVQFNAADMPHGELPEVFSLRLATTPLAAGSEWMVRVNLNGNLVETRRFAGTSKSIDFDTALPPERLSPINTLIIELADTTPVAGVCGRPLESQAQLLPESTFDDRSGPAMAWAQIIETIADAPKVALSASNNLRPEQAAVASELIAQLMPLEAEMRFDGDAPIVIRIVDGASFANGMSNMLSSNKLTAIFPGRALQPFRVLPVPSAELGSAISKLGPDDVFLLVSGL
jgi:hypothetical protein